MDANDRIIFLLFASILFALLHFPSAGCGSRTQHKKVGYISMTQDELEKWIKQLIAEDKLYKFYKCKEWRQLSDAVMKENNYECQYCKAQGIHTAARSVHHVQWVRRYPRLALSRTYVYNGQTYKNLIPLCEDCHNKEHDKSKGLVKENKNKFVNEERW